MFRFSRIVYYLNVFLITKFFFIGGSNNKLCSNKSCGTDNNLVCCQQNTGCKQCVGKINKSIIMYLEFIIIFIIVQCPRNPIPPTNCLKGFISYDSPTNCTSYICTENYEKTVALDDASVLEALNAALSG